MHARYRSIVLLLFPLVLFANQFDSTGKTVSFYPSALMIAHNARPVIFFKDTHVLNLKLRLQGTPFGKPPNVKIKCSQAQQNFMNSVLLSLRETHKNIRRLMSLPGFSNLLECDTYLARAYTAETKRTSKMFCGKKAYKPSLKSCKNWALDNCMHLNSDEKLWLKQHSRVKRNAWACHSGFLGLFRKIYTTFGGSCESDKLVGLRKTLIQMTDALKDEQALITTVNGKTVQLFSITDKLTSRVNSLASDISQIDKIFSQWKKELNKFGKRQIVIMTLY